MDSKGYQEVLKMLLFQNIKAIIQFGHRLFYIIKLLLQYKHMSFELKLTFNNTDCLWIKLFDYPFEIQRSIMSLILPTLLQDKIKSIEKQTYKPHRLAICATHHQQLNFTCLSSKCSSYCTPTCRDCHSPRCSHQLLQINRIVPRLAQWTLGEWSEIQKDHKQIESEWKVCLVNINYCLDILRQVRKQIEQRSQSAQLTLFQELLGEVHGMFVHDSNNQSVEMLLRNFSRLNKKYQFLTTEDKPATSVDCQEERKHKKSQVKKASNSTKQFSESALAFSENLAKIVEERVKFQKRVSRLREISNNRIFNLRDLLKQEAKPQEIEELMIELPKGTENHQEQPIEQLIQKCSNLQSLRINNRNGGIEKRRWKKIMTGMEYLKQLKELSLHLRAADLPILTQLFKERSKAIRQVEKLTLQITDEKELKVSDVWDFLNTMELRSLNLTLSRDNLRKAQVVELLQKIRLASSMTHLPLAEFNLNLNKNKIDSGQEIADLTHLFNQRAANIKTKSIII